METQTRVKFWKATCLLRETEIVCMLQCSSGVFANCLIFQKFVPQLFQVWTVFLARGAWLSLRFTKPLVCGVSAISSL